MTCSSLSYFPSLSAINFENSQKVPIISIFDSPKIWGNISIVPSKSPSWLELIWSIAVSSELGWILNMAGSTTTFAPLTWGSNLISTGWCPLLIILIGCSISWLIFKNPKLMKGSYDKLLIIG